jgi:hypothetical protein
LHIGAIGAGLPLGLAIPGQDLGVLFLRNVQRIVEAHQDFRTVLAGAFLETLSDRRETEQWRQCQEDAPARRRNTGQALTIDRVIVPADIFIEPNQINWLALKCAPVHLISLEPDERAATALAAQRDGIDEVGNAARHGGTADDVVERDQAGAEPIDLADVAEQLYLHAVTGCC